MNSPTTVTNLPPKFILISRLSGGLTIVLSLIYVLLSVTYYAFRFNCTAGSTASTNGARYFWHTIFRVYILSSSCAEERLTIAQLTDETTVLILVSVALAIAVVFAGVAIILVTIIQDDGLSQYVDKVVYAYIGCFIASLAVDLTTASYFGVDYGYLTSLLKELSAGSPANYKLEVIRQGVFWLMTITLKGYIAYIINGIFITLMAVYVIEMQNKNKDEHSIHKLGALSAYDQRRKLDDSNWSQSDVYNNPLFMRGPQLNTAFIEDSTPPRSPRRPEPQRFDHMSNRSFDRSDSWHHSQNAMPNSARPFSYLEELKRPVQLKSRDTWSQPGPNVPAPDYSPEQPRKLKSALKTAYI